MRLNRWRHYRKRPTALFRFFEVVPAFWKNHGELCGLVLLCGKGVSGEIRFGTCLVKRTLYFVSSDGPARCVRPRLCAPQYQSSPLPSADVSVHPRPSFLPKSIHVRVSSVVKSSTIHPRSACLFHDPPTAGVWKWSAFGAFFCNSPACAPSWGTAEDSEEAWSISRMISARSCNSSRLEREGAALLLLVLRSCAEGQGVPRALWSTTPPRSCSSMGNLSAGFRPR